MDDRLLALGSPPLHTVALLTRDRAQALARSLRSHLEHARSFGRPLRANVLDSSTDPEQQAHTRVAARALALETGSPVNYASTEDRTSFAHRLAETSGVRPDLVQFALADLHACGGDTGANRNALLLGHPGRIFLSSDDDVVCEPHRRPSAPDEPAVPLRVTSERDPTRVTLFDSLVAARAAVPAAAIDLFAAHEQLIGRTVASLLSERAPEAVSIDGRTSSLLHSLLEGRACVAVTASAILGDCGARFPAFYLCRPEVRNQLASLPEPQYAALVESRQVVRAAVSPTVTSGPFLMAYHLTFDNRSLLPPFVPVLRGQDITFGRLLRRFSDAHLIAHLPDAILHEPLEPRRASLQHLWPRTQGPAFASVLDACLRMAAQGWDAPAAGAGRLISLGRRLRDLAGQEELEFDRTARLGLAEGINAQLLGWERALERAPVPPGPWLRDFDGIRMTILAWLEPDRQVVATELVERFGLAEGRRLTRRLISDFGELLVSWPAIAAAATDLDRAGKGLFLDR